MSCEVGEKLPEDQPVSAEEHSVKNLASMFNQTSPGSAAGPPAIAAKPKPTPSMKPGRLDLDNKLKIIAPNIRPGHFEKPSNGTAKPPGKVPPKPSPTSKVPLGGAALMGPKSADILNMKSHLKKTPIPRPPPTSSPSEGFKVELKRSIKKPPLAPPRLNGSIKESPAAEEADGDNKENVSSSKSEGDSSSLSSFTSDTSIPRRGSETSQKASSDKIPLLEPLPPLETIGPPPKKPAKPGNIQLPKSAAPPTAGGRKSSLHGAARKAEPVGEEFGDLYDDVSVDIVAAKKRISLIPTMDSDEEESVEDLLYDDTEAIQQSALPPPPSAQAIPPVPQTSGSDEPQEIYDDVVTNEGEMEELYEALEATDVQERPPLESSESADVVAKRAPAASLPSPKKSMPPSKSRQEEKQRKELEKQELIRRKKEEELRKKREKDEKKRKEKEEKEMKKKFNFKGDVRILDTATATQDCGSDYEKTDLICKRGDRLEILRRDGNPPGKWLARDTQGRYGFVDADFVAVEMDSQETYDDVIPCDDSGSEEDQDQEIYEAFD